MIEVKLFEEFRFQTVRLWVKIQERSSPMTQQSLSIKAIAEICQSRALEYRRQASHERKTAFGSAKDHDKALAFEAKDNALEQLASDLIAGRLSVSPIAQTDEIDDFAIGRA